MLRISLLLWSSASGVKARIFRSYLGLTKERLFVEGLSELQSSLASMN